MYKRYEGNSGQMRRVEDPPPPARGPLPPPPGPGPDPPPPGPPGGLGALLGGLRPLERLRALETEDLLLALILYLLYRESGESEWLVALGAMVFLD